MAECQEDIVFRKDGIENDDDAAAVALDDTALVRAYEEAVKSSRWSVGSRCCAVWSEDGLVYPAALVGVNGEKGQVKFDGYGNEEEVELSALLPEAAEQSWRDRRVLQWVLGSRCRAVWSEDGLVYPAVLVWIKGDRCRVQFDCYGNEEELELSGLLPPEEPERNGDVEVQAPKGEPGGSSCSDWRKKKKEKTTLQSEDPPVCHSSNTPSGEEKDQGPCDPVKGQREGRKVSGRRERREGPSHHLPLFPPVPPPPVSPVDFLPLPLLPPPPPCVWPPWKRGDEDDDGLDADVTALSSMLLSWYLCGYHTGCYMAMQQTKASHEMDDRKKHGAKHEKYT